MTGSKDAIGNPEKPRLSLIPKVALWALGKALAYGEKHYGQYNFKKGIPVSILCDSALRHIHQFMDGEDMDVESQNLHLGNAMANLAMAIDMMENKKECDDRYKNTLIPGGTGYITITGVESDLKSLTIERSDHYGPNCSCDHLSPEQIAQSMMLRKKDNK